MQFAAAVPGPALGPGELTALLASRRPLRHARGELIHPAGAPATRLYLVAQGRVRLSRPVPDGHQVTLALLDEGMAFGHEALLDDAAYGARAEALRDCVLQAFTRSEVLALVDARPDAGLALMAALAERLTAADEQIASLAFRSVGARLAAKLLELADRYGRITPAGVRIEERFTHQQLSELIGTSRETLTKALNELRVAGIVEVAERRLVLRDQAVLERMRRAR
jgi:CRP-like cAMP-binding protein